MNIFIRNFTPSHFLSVIFGRLHTSFSFLKSERMNTYTHTHLHLLIKRSIDTGDVQSVWKRANVSPIFKGGDRTDVNNYRPISLTYILSKVAEHLLHHNIYSQKNNMAFTKDLTLQPRLLHVIHFAAQSLDVKERYHIVSFDFSKAFDRVPSDLLIH